MHGSTGPPRLYNTTTLTDSSSSSSMGRLFRDLIGALRETAALSCSAATSSVAPGLTSPHLAVLRATTHHPSTSPPSPNQISTLLAFGHHSRLSAASVVTALTSRLSTQNPTIAFKTLFSIHHLLAHGAFILLDTLSTALRPAGRNPLNLSAFRDSSSSASWLLSDWVRWYARVIESLLAATDSRGNDTERLSALLNRDLIVELEALVRVVEEVAQAPDAPAVENGLVWEAVRLVEEDRLAAERGIVARVKELRERFGSIRFGDLVQLVCLCRRLEECKDRPVGGKWRKQSGEWFWSEVEEVTRMAEEVVGEERGRLRRERLVESARMSDRALVGSIVPVGFGSMRVSVDR